MHVWSRPPAIVSVSVSQQDKDETDFFCPETKCGVKTIDRNSDKNRPEISDLSLNKFPTI